MTHEEPFLQIVHTSDLHVVSPEFNWEGLRGLQRAARFFSADLETRILQGTAGHHPVAPYLFAEFLSRITKAHPIWSNQTTWLADTGDLSTFGDAASLQLGQEHHTVFSRRTSASARIHGNHDAWPMAMPPFAGTSASQQAKTVSQFFPASPPLQLRIPGGGEVHLFTLNTVIAHRSENARAVGRIDATELARLKELAAQMAARAEGPTFRILLTHHPICYPDAPTRPPRFTMVLENAREVASELRGPCPGVAGPLVHLVLSGHVHRLFPPHGSLPTTVRELSQPDLGPDQMQLLVGSLLQVQPWPTSFRPSKTKVATLDMSDRPCQCQVLRFYATPGMKGMLRLERLFAALPAVMREGRWRLLPGPYGLVPVDRDRLAESMHATFA